MVSASASVAQKVEFHTTREVEGYQRMEQLERLELSPKGSLELAPGGTHLMLLGLDHMPAIGESVQLCLQLASSDEVCTRAEVRKTAGAQSSHQHHHHN